MAQRIGGPAAPKRVVPPLLPPGGDTDDVLAKKSPADGDAEWKPALAVAGVGDVVGPASSTNHNVPQFNGTTGKRIEDSGIAISSLQQVDEQTMQQMSGLTIDTDWRDWAPTGVTLVDQAVYQLWLKVTEGSDYVVAMGQFVWSTASPAEAFDHEVILFQTRVYSSGGKSIFVQVSAPGSGAYRLQLAATAAMTNPVVNAKFRRIM